MDEKEFIIKLCKTKGAYEALPEKKINLDFTKIKSKYNTLIDTPICIVIKDKCEIVVHKHGRLLFKKCKYLEYIEKMCKELYRLK